VEISYDSFNRNRRFHTRITIDKYKESKVRQELYQANPYGKPLADARGFSFLFLYRATLTTAMIQNMILKNSLLMS
jgi:hypothetical protein